MAGELVLVIEDNALNRKLLRDVLHALGYVVLEAETAEEGLVIARDRLPDLVLMDIQLPGMDGVTATRLLRADERTRAIRIIAVTASVVALNTTEIASAGFDAVHTKPISVAQLVDEVRRALRQDVPSRRVEPAPIAAPARGGGAHVLIVDDTPRNVKLLHDLLVAQGYRVSTAGGGEEALRSIAVDPPDLVLLDVMMPDISGYDVCRRLRGDERTALLPVVLVTALDATEERVQGIEAGADDFLSKPVNQAELFARVRSLLRIRDLHATVRRQAEELADWNRMLTARVDAQVTQIARLDRLRRFFPPHVADAIARDDESLLQPHRRMVAVVSIDLRGFTAFAESAEPEEVMGVLREYHREMGRLITHYDGTLEYFAGDGIVVVFNDPVQVEDPYERAVRMALDMRDRVEVLRAGWSRLGFDLGVGFGVGAGYATAGVVGFEERWDYTVIGTVMNQTSRLVAAAEHGQVLTTERVIAAVEASVEAEAVGELALKGLRRPVATFSIRRWIGRRAAS
jgi:CheY-like chemotaxis protein